MEVLNNHELSQVNGGAFWKSFACAIGLAAAFIAGLVSGYVNPLKCN